MLPTHKAVTAPLRKYATRGGVDVNGTDLTHDRAAFITDPVGGCFAGQGAEPPVQRG